MNSPFQLLSDIELRMREHAVSLPEEQIPEGSWKGVIFYLKEWGMVARQGMVREVIIPSRITRVPGTHPWVIGVANVHGNALPVVDLADFFWGKRLSISQSSRILPVCDGDLECGVLVSEVKGISHFSQQDVCTKPASYPAELSDYLAGCYQHQGVLWGEFSIRELLESPGFIDLSVR